MTEQVRPTFLRRKLGAKLRRLREQAGLTLAVAAPKLDKQKSSLHRIEIGQTKADVHFVRSLMDLYDCYDEDLLDETREALKPPWFRAYGLKNMGYVDVETEADEVNEFSLIIVPGLLQTEAYMEAMFREHPGWEPGEADKHIAVRIIRRGRLTGEDRPLKLVAVVYETALRTEIGGPDVMREQLRHLIQMAALPTVTLQVIPLKSAHYALEGSFILLRFPDPEDPELLYVEYLTGSLHIEKAPEVQEGRLVFDRLQSDALSPSESVQLLEGLIAELDGS
ncbi:MAG: helix-turn-helix transcriptional regulator [Kibdelosporangium sp.]